MSNKPKPYMADAYNDVLVELCFYMESYHVNNNKIQALSAENKVLKEEIEAYIKIIKSLLDVNKHEREYLVELRDEINYESMHIKKEKEHINKNFRFMKTSK